MKITLFELTILAIIHECVGGQREIPKNERDREDKEILDVYYNTDPFRRCHERRMRNKLPKFAIPRNNNKRPMKIRQHALFIIARDCHNWRKMTGWDQETTDKQLAHIYSVIRTDEPDQEGRMYRKLLTDYEQLHSIDPQMIRSVVHDWFRRKWKDTGRIGTVSESQSSRKRNRVEYGKGATESSINSELRSSFSQALSPLNQRILDAYHATDPFTVNHERRMSDRLTEPHPKYLRQHAIYLMKKMCEEWEWKTGLSQDKTNEILANIYSKTKTNEGDQEARIRDKLLQVRPETRELDPEIIRSVVHDWYRPIKRAMIENQRIRSRENLADLLYTYSRIHSGNGSISDRLADKWKQFHPQLSISSKATLIKKTYLLSGDPHAFTPEEMEAARARYENVFKDKSETYPEDTTVRKRIKWTVGQKVDLIYIYNLSKKMKKKCNVEQFIQFWHKVHPELAHLSKNSLLKQVTSMIRRNFQLTPKEEAAAESRFEAALGQNKQSQQDTALNEQDGLPVSQSFHAREFHQQETDSMTHSSPLHNNYGLTDEDWKYLRTFMNDESSSDPATPHYSPSSYHYENNSSTALNQIPFEISSSHSDIFANEPYTANPYYGHGNSSHSNYNSHL